MISQVLPDKSVSVYLNDTRLKLNHSLIILISIMNLRNFKKLFLIDGIGQSFQYLIMIHLNNYHSLMVFVLVKVVLM